MDNSKPPKTPPENSSSISDRMIPIGTPKKSESTSAPNICLHFLLRPEAHETTPNVVIDFIKQAEERYGFEKIHPDSRTAQDLLNDDDDVDDDDNEDIDLTGGDLNPPPSSTTPGAATTTTTNATAATTSSSTTTTTTTAAPSKRNRIEGKYDLNDPFIDDSELQWEEQAASTKDGFFVYSGPLVQDGEQPQIERADGTIKKKETQSTTGNKKGPRKKKDDTDTTATSTSSTKRPKSKSTDKEGPTKKKTKTAPSTAEKKEKSTATKKSTEPKPKKEKKEPKLKQTKLGEKASATKAKKDATTTQAQDNVGTTISDSNTNPQDAPPLVPIAPKPISAATTTAAATAVPPSIQVVDLTVATPPSPQQQARTSASIANLLI